MKNYRRNEIQNQPKTGEILSDGKRDWRKYKLQSLAISRAYAQFQEIEKYAHLIAECGNWLKFKTCPKGHELRLVGACFCRCRLCVTCQWRKSLAMYAQVIQLVHAHKKRYKSDIPLLLTLTVPNVKKVDLKKRLDLMQRAFRLLSKRTAFKQVARSWFRSLEITYNEERDDYHPHYHVLLLVPENYFKRNRGIYLSQKDWLKLWQEATGMSEITQVDIRRVRKEAKKKPIEAIVAEVAKYATKPNTYVKRTSEGEYEANAEVVYDLHRTLHRKKMTAFGGLFVKLRKELRLQDIEKQDLVHITDEHKECKCSVCQSSLQDEMYRWQMSVGRYVN